MRIDILSRLNPVRIGQIRELERCCREFDGTKSEIYLNNDLNFRRSFKGFYLAYEKGELIGVLTLFAPDYPQAEVYAYTRPDMRRKGVFNALLEAAGEELYEWYIEKLIYVIEPESKAAVAVAAHKKLQYIYSELLMQLDTEKYEKYINCEAVNVPDDALELKLSGEIKRAAKPKGMEENPLHFELFRREETAPIGSVRVDVGESTFFICGVKIKETERSRGYGKALMRKLLATLRRMDSAKDIKLEVSSTNYPACHIYEQLGFVKVAEIRYYE